MTDFLAIRAQSNGTYRVEKLSGIDYIVVPVVALVEGVLQGVTAEQPELALASEFGRFPMAWNGRPITVDHPYVVDSANNEIIRVSANTSPEVLENFQIGFIFNTKLDGTKLTMEAWIDPHKASMHSDAARTLMSKIKKGEKIEVSTGLFTGSEETKGVHNEREYFGVWRGVVPDHLALLPDGLVGACSNADGCGVYANAAGDLSIRVHKLRASCSCDSGAGANVGVSPSPSKTNSPVANAALSFKPNEFLAHLVPDGMLDMDIRTIIQGQLDDEYPGAWCYLIGFTSSVAVFSMYDSIDGDRDTYQCSYSIDPKTKSCTLEDDCIEVILTTTITEAPDPDGGSKPISPKDLSAVSTTPSQENPMTTANTTPAAAGTTTPAITANAARTFLQDFGHTETALKAMKDEDVLKLHTSVTTKLNAYAKANAPAANDDDEDDNMPAGGKKSKTNTDGTPVAAAATTTPATPQTAEQFLQSAPPGIRESIEAGMKMHAKHKKDLITKILANTRNKFTEKQLETFDSGVLENMAELAVQPDYSGQAPAGSGIHAQSQQPTVNEGDSHVAAAPPRLVQKAATAA